MNAIKILRDLKTLIVKNKKFFFVVLIIFVFYFLSMVIVAGDKDFSERWIAFGSWSISLLILPSYILFKKVRNGIILPSFDLESGKKIILPFATILCVALIFSFAFLISYPFVSIQDQLREGGLNAREILDGSIKNIFGYGRYIAQGLIHPTITSFFYLIFGPSALVYRFPAAVASVLDVIVLYLAASRFINRSTAFWASLVLITIPLHIYYGRTESLIIFTSLFTSIILYLLALFHKKKNAEIYALLGLFLGFTAGFYASIRTVAVLVMGIVFLITFYEISFKKNKKVFWGLVLLALFFLIGFGPRLLYTTPNIFFRGGRLFTYSDSETSFSNAVSKINIGEISANYKKSMLVYFSEPVFSVHYPDYRPIFTIPLAVLLFIGLIASIFSKNILLRYSALFVVVIPFTNSAITDNINSDNRLSPMFPTSAILIGYGIYFIFSKVKEIRGKNSAFRYCVMMAKATLALYVIIQGINFFEKESGAKIYTYEDYLQMHALYFLNSNIEYRNLNRVCLFVPRNVYNNIDKDRLLYEEQFEYFYPYKEIGIIPTTYASSNQIFISKSCNGELDASNFIRHEICSNYKKFACPKNGGAMDLFSEDQNAAARQKVFSDPFSKTSGLSQPFIMAPLPRIVP